MRRVLLACALAASGTAFAQSSPTPSFDDPRLQTVAYGAGQTVRVTAFPNSTLTVVLMPGDRIDQVSLSDPTAFAVKPTGPGDGLEISPLRPDAAARLQVHTTARQYQLELGTGQGLMAAYLVRYVAAGAAEPAGRGQVALPAMSGRYRVTGEPALQPSRIGDDGERTYIEWGLHQSLPAVFGIGANGEEEVVDGYMRGDVFTIDRVYRDLVFRIDRKIARARRTSELEAG